MPFLESIISKLATIEISFFELVSEAEETGLSLALSETPKAFLACRDPNRSIFLFLAHLSRRLMGELIVYQSLRRPSVNIFKHLLL